MSGAEICHQLSLQLDDRWMTVEDVDRIVVFHDNRIDIRFTREVDRGVTRRAGERVFDLEDGIVDVVCGASDCGDAVAVLGFEGDRLELDFHRRDGTICTIPVNHTGPETYQVDCRHHQCTVRHDDLLRAANKALDLREPVRLFAQTRKRRSSA